MTSEMDTFIAFIFLTLKVVVISTIVCTWMNPFAYSQEISVFPGDGSGPVIKIPSESHPLRSLAPLICGIEPTSLMPQLNYTSQWITPAGEIVNFTNNNFAFIEGEIRVNATKTYPATILWVKRLTYKDAGVYTCQVRSTTASENSRSPWVSVNIELQLSLELQPINSTVVKTVENLDDTAELSCEMSAFIRPDLTLIWKGPQGQRIANSRLGKTKYKISFSDGRPKAAVNGSVAIVPSRVSTLSILNLKASDAGNYTCQVLGSREAATISLLVSESVNDVIDSRLSEDVIETSNFSSNTSSTPGSVVSTATPLISSTNFTALIAGSVAVAAAFGLILSTIALCLCLRWNKRVHRKDAQTSYSNYPIYDYPNYNIPENLTNDYQIVDIGRTQVGDNNSNNMLVITGGTEDVERNEAYGVSNNSFNENSFMGTDVSCDVNSDTCASIILERNEAYGEVEFENVNIYVEID